MKNKIEKVKRYVWGKVVSKFRMSKLYPYIYRSYLNSILSSKKQEISLEEIYFAARPNPGAGIGHQMANWIAGYWFAKMFGLKFAHIPFASKNWDAFLGFGEGEIQFPELISQGYRKVLLPLFDEFYEPDIERTKNIINSYTGKRVVFLCEQDQFFEAHYKVLEEIQQKFYSSQSRQNDKLLYQKEEFNIAIHVRRGDILSDTNDPGLTKRFLSNDYYEKVLKAIIRNLKVDRPIRIFFFSQGVPEDFPGFKDFPNLRWCFEMDDHASFLHMVFSDLLITSKSSFSYKPALLNRGVKVCPRDFWHTYPNRTDWILCENDGSIKSIEFGDFLK